MAVTKTQLWLRVNNIEIEDVRFRREMVDGYPLGDWEIVIKDPHIGWFAVNDSFVLEYTRDRRKRWEITSVKNFLAMLDSL